MIHSETKNAYHLKKTKTAAAQKRKTEKKTLKKIAIKQGGKHDTYY
jgi:hypothetical protein